MGRAEKENVFMYSGYASTDITEKIRVKLAPSC